MAWLKKCPSENYNRPMLNRAADERVLDVQFTEDSVSVFLRDARIISVPLAWYPRLLNATPKQRKNWEKIPTRHWGSGYSDWGILRSSKPTRTLPWDQKICPEAPSAHL